MIKKLLTLFIALFATVCFASEPKLRGYDEYKIPTGYFVPIMSLQEFSTAYTEEGEKLNFVTTNDIYIFDKNIIPQGSKLTGYIDKKNEPVRGTNAAMTVYINKLYLPDGFEIPIKAYIYTANNNKIGGELTPPLTWNKIPHYQRWTMHRAMGVVQCVPGDQRKMGEHVTISSGANLTMVLVAPINMTHIVIN
ncbi:MAG: hypothetical protein E7Z89_04165 [Cyanobacteria bacterium SIG28]|nr:hypothetical protein [Cyanobacteria bacterium SIG28]